MFPSINEIKQAAIGCWQLALGNKAGEHHFDLSLQGFWRSFRWVYVIAVLDTIDGLVSHFVILPQDEIANATSIVWLMLVDSIASFVAFLLFPIVVALLAKPMDLSKRYASYIVGRNWLTVFMSAVGYLVDVGYWLGLESDEFYVVLEIGLAGASLYVGTMIALSFLGTSRSFSFGFALIDFLLAVLIGETAHQLVSW